MGLLHRAGASAAEEKDEDLPGRSASTSRVGRSMDREGGGAGRAVSEGPARRRKEGGAGSPRMKGQRRSKGNKGMDDLDYFSESVMRSRTARDFARGAPYSLTGKTPVGVAKEVTQPRPFVSMELDIQLRQHKMDETIITRTEGPPWPPWPRTRATRASGPGRRETNSSLPYTTAGGGLGVSFVLDLWLLCAGSGLVCLSDFAFCSCVVMSCCLPSWFSLRLAT